MKFVLTFDGELPSAGNGSHKKQKKWEIRNHFHPQLQQLWQVHPALLRVDRHRYFNKAMPSLLIIEGHHDYEDNWKAVSNGHPDEVDLLEPFCVGGSTFVPLVRKSFALTCSLKIKFLRQGAPGNIYSGGDIDNRLKTLLDALSKPTPEQVINDSAISGPIFCLLEDDSLLTGISVETERLLNRPDSPRSFVHLTIEVDVRVADSRRYNSMFLGD
ncbi:hypothetical protein [Methylosinus sporium]|uniref:hypothetical protein n=1 Tax=Methylosinus sporium TaxID=428 RepID=UPI0011B29350|nr:hypothetical protein [Methylosinus sporium]